MPGDSPGFASVVFDFDSTLSAIEGIDVLAGACGDKVRAMTERAMSGELPLEAVYGERLALIRPTRSDIDRLTGIYADHLVPDAVDTLRALDFLRKRLRIVSGGLLPAVLPVARLLGLSPEQVAAVDLELDAAGDYVGFDSRSPLTRAGGKGDVIRDWELPGPILLVGDGATDLEARPAVDAFVAFMGVVHRPAVAAGADFVISGRSLAPVLAIAPSAAERELLRENGWGPLLERAEAALDPAVRT